MATLTTVVSRIDMIAPSTTTVATSSSLRSSPSSGLVWAGGAFWSWESWAVHDGEQHGVDELLEEGAVKRFAGDQRAREDHRAGDVREQGGHRAADLAAQPRPGEQRVVAPALVGDHLVAEQRVQLAAGP